MVAGSDLAHKSRVCAFACAGQPRQSDTRKMRKAAAVIAIAAAADAFAPMPSLAPAKNRAALCMMSGDGKGPEAKLPTNLAKEGTIEANRKQWGITEPLKAGAADDGEDGMKWILQPPVTNPSERGVLRKETDTVVREREERAANAYLSNTVPASKVPLNKAKMGTVTANREQWGITEPLGDDSPKWVLQPPVTNPSERGVLRKETDTMIREREEKAAAALAANKGPRSITAEELKALVGKFKGMSREEAEPKLQALGYEGELLESLWGSISGPAWVLSPPQTQPVERGLLRRGSDTAVREREEKAAAAAAAAQGGARSITQSEVKALASKFKGMSREEAEPKLQALGYEGALLDAAWREIQAGPLWPLQPPQTQPMERGLLRRGSDTAIREREERAAAAAAAGTGGVRSLTQDEVKALARQFARMPRDEAVPKLQALGYEGALLDAAWREIQNYEAKWFLSPPQTQPVERGLLRRGSDTTVREREERAASMSPMGRMDLAKAGALEANRKQWGIEEPLKPNPQAPDVPWLFSPPQTKTVERGSLRTSSSDEGAGGVAGSNMAKAGAVAANKEQWGIDGPVKIDPAALAAKAAASAPAAPVPTPAPPAVPVSKLPLNKAKETALAANKEQWGISEPLEPSVADQLRSSEAAPVPPTPVPARATAPAAPVSVPAGVPGYRAVTNDEVRVLAGKFGDLGREEAEMKLMALGYEGSLLEVVFKGMQTAKAGKLALDSHDEMMDEANRLQTRSEVSLAKALKLEADASAAKAKIASELEPKVRELSEQLKAAEDKAGSWGWNPFSSSKDEAEKLAAQVAEAKKAVEELNSESLEGIAGAAAMQAAAANEAAEAAARMAEAMSLKLTTSTAAKAQAVADLEVELSKWEAMSEEEGAAASCTPLALELLANAGVQPATKAGLTSLAGRVAKVRMGEEPTTLLCETLQPKKAAGSASNEEGMSEAIIAAVLAAAAGGIGYAVSQGAANYN